MKNILEVEDLGIMIDGEKIVKDISFFVHDQHITCIVGESGSPFRGFYLVRWDLILRANHKAEIPFKVGSLVTPSSLLTSLTDVSEMFAYFKITEINASL